VALGPRLRGDERRIPRQAAISFKLFAESMNPAPARATYRNVPVAFARVPILFR